ncbi:hypothetical protein EXE48_13045 [Halorubrum sp. ASP1]|jgi:hypothetical protein|uniref:hypothetical protein n=1 Tax=Halobacteriales TaxID=2235 RepID=UPI001092CFFB|nr:MULTISPECIES: hypothetical protein [Halobacteria]TKX60489.1 hypothetical protein EXE48_13045 [Halorubrum sp. ASP1]
MPRTYESIPRVGNQDLLKGIEKLAQIVQFRGQLTKDELRDEMEAINRDRDSKLFKSIDEWFKFTFQDQNCSIEIIKEADGHVELTEDGKELLTAPDFRVAAFQLLERKSRTNFTHFYDVLQQIEQKVQAGNYDMGSDLEETIYTWIQNKVTAGAIACFLKDFEIVVKDDGRWEINPAQYTYLQGDDEDIVEDIIAEHGNRMDLAELEQLLTLDFKWGDEQVDDIIQELQDQNRVATDRYEGKTVIELVTT